MTVGAIGGLLVCLIAGWRYETRARRCLHLLQLEHYENARLHVWLRRRGELIDVTEAGAAGVAAAAAVALAIAAPGIAELIAWVVALVALGDGARRQPARTDVKPLVFTQRATRLFAASLLAPVTAALLGAVGTLVVGSDVPLAVAALAVVSSLAAAPWLMTLANSALAPIQRRVNAGFEAAARAKLAAIDPRVVGITGSYGKTTTKVCVGAVLGERMQTLITPASYNSQLGVIRTINEHLEGDHRAFVVEMGMYRAGDIAQLCELVHPSIGVLTAIGPVHLERLGSIEAIAAAKAELALALPADGQLVVNADDPRCLEVAGRVAVDTIRYGLDDPAADVRAESIEIADGASRFELVIDDARRGGGRIIVSAGLLGRHNVSNLLAAAAVGHVLGLSLEEIARGLGRVAPPDHRLQPIPNPRAGIVVIDDAYNSNPAGAAAALEVLREHPARRRILVTPGMVELGDRERELNERFGRQAAEVCDHVILVGPERTRPIGSGLRAARFDPDAITVVRDIAAATRVLSSLTRAGDVILFENDLPDMYSEPEPAPGDPIAA